MHTAVCQLNEVAAFFWRRFFLEATFPQDFCEIEGGPLETGCAAAGTWVGVGSEEKQESLQSLSAVRLRSERVKSRLPGLGQARASGAVEDLRARTDQRSEHGVG